MSTDPLADLLPTRSTIPATLDLAPVAVDDAQDPIGGLSLDDGPVAGANWPQRQQMLITRLLLGTPEADELRRFQQETCLPHFFSDLRSGIMSWIQEHYKQMRALPSFEQCLARFGDVAHTAVLPEHERGRALSSAVTLPALLQSVREAFCETTVGEMLTAAVTQYADVTRRHLVETTLHGGLARIASAANGTMRVKSMAEMATSIEERYAAVKRGQLWGVPIPFPFLQQSLRGWQDGDFVYIVARPSVGKTWLLCQAAAAAATGNPWLFSDPAKFSCTMPSGEERRAAAVTTLVVSAEMPPLDLAYRIAAMIGHLPYAPMRGGTMNEKDETTLRALTDMLRRPDGFGSRLHITDALTPTQIMSEADRLNAKLIAVDGFYLLAGKGEKRWERFQHNSETLRRYVLNAGRVMVATSQLDVNVDKVAFSQAVDQDASVLLQAGASNEQRSRRQICISPKKVREGSVDQSMLYNMDPSTSAFDEVGIAPPKAMARRRGF